MAAVSEPVSNKSIMYRLVKTGRFGNYPCFWSTLEEVERSGFGGLVSLRSLETSNPVRLYHIPAKELRKTVEALPAEVRAAGLTFSEAPPDHLRTIQGEYDGHNLFYSFDPSPMRIALEKDGRQADGLTAKMLMRQHLDPGDVEWIEELLEDFPNHVVEFSGFRVRCGQLKRRTIIWEVRLY